MAGDAWTENGRFVTGSQTVELDELMSMTYFGVPQHRSDRNDAARHFVLELDRVRDRDMKSGDEHSFYFVNQNEIRKSIWELGN